MKLFLRKCLSLNLDSSTITTDARLFDPVVLAPTRLQNQELPQGITAKAPGLHMKRHHGTAVIGWEEDKVNAEIAFMEETERRGQEKEEALQKGETGQRGGRKKSEMGAPMQGAF